MAAYKKYRKHNKIYELPEHARAMLDDMLQDTSITYVEIAQWLKDEGFDISKSTVGRYALENNKLTVKLLEAQEQINTLVRLAKDNDGENLTEGALQIATHKLTAKIAMLETEIDDMDAADAIRLMTGIARTKAYKDKVYAALRSAWDNAYEAFLRQVDAEIDSDPALRKRLEEIAKNTLGKVVE